MWCPPTPCGTYCCGRGWLGGCWCSGINWCGGYSWQSCYSVPGIELWPTLTFCGSCDMPMVATASTGLVWNLEAPPQPYEAYTLTLKACDCSCSVNGSGFTINIIPTDISVTQNNGSFSATIDLGGFSSTYNQDGIDYSLSIATSLLFCLDPTGGSSWINIVLDCNFAANMPDVYDESVSFCQRLNINIMEINIMEINYFIRFFII